MTDQLASKHKSTILQLYFVFIASLIGSFIPNAAAQMLGLILLVSLMVAVPIYGATAPKGSLLRNHMRYLNGTIWTGSTLLAIGFALMCFWLYSKGDLSSYDTFKSQIENGTMLDEASLTASIEAMLSYFLQTNMGLIVQSGVICLGPPILFIIFRIMKAMARASTYAPVTED